MKRDTRFLTAVLAFFPTAILSSATLCSWAIANGASMRWRVLFRVMCHGIPERCFFLFGVPMPICARCTAIYAGVLGGIAAFWILPLIRETAARWMLFASAIPMAIDGLTQLARLRESTNVLRLETGLAAGICLSFWALTAVENRVDWASSSREIDGVPGFAERAATTRHHSVGERVGQDGEVHPVAGR